MHLYIIIACSLVMAIYRVTFMICGEVEPLHGHCTFRGRLKRFYRTQLEPQLTVVATNAFLSSTMHMQSSDLYSKEILLPVATTCTEGL